MESQVRTRRDFLKMAGFCASGLSVAGCGTGPVARPRPDHLRVARPQQERPNILWITCEDISPWLGCYGDPYALTPNLDRFAGQSIVYDKAFVTAPVCAPVRSCLVTGVYATSLGTQHLRSEIALPTKVQPWPKLLRAVGYYCSNNYKEDYNFTDPTIWDDSSQTAHWRHRAVGQPFFSVFNLMSTHQGQINGSDEAFFETYRSKLTAEERHDPNRLLLPPFYPDTPMVRKIWARYYDLITYMDKQVGELLAALEADRLADSTIVFFFSDHGMGLPRYKRTLYDSGLRVPLMVRFPGPWQRLAPLTPGGRTDRLVSTVDLPPTVLELVGVAVPDYMQGRPFLGPQPAPPRDSIYGATSRVDEVYEVSRCVRDQRYKYIHNFMPHLSYVQPSEYPDRAEIMKELRGIAERGGMIGPQKALWEPTKPVEELYDTQADPHEIDNLADSAAHRDILVRLRKRLREWMLETHDTGLLSEAEMHIRAGGSTPYEVTQDPRRYPQQRILAAAELVGSGTEALPAWMEYLEDPDSAVRYWAALGLKALGPEAAPATEALKRALTDASPSVRFTAAGALCQMDSCEEALFVLAEGLRDPREPVVLHAARTLQQIGKKACPLTRLMQTTRQRCKNLDGTYKNDDHAMFIDWALKYAMENCTG